MFVRAVFYFLLLVGVVSGSLPAGAATPQFPVLTGRVVDDAHLLNAGTAEAITNKLAALEQKTGDQLVVVTLPSLQGYEIEDYGYQLGRAWGIGQKGKNNGAILVVAPNEHRVRIEVGYGLEGILTDAVSRVIIENAILPRFRANDYAGGISLGVDDIIQVLSGNGTGVERPAAQANPPPGSADYAKLIWAVLFIGLWLFLASRRRRSGYGGGGPWIVPVGGGWSSPGDWGGGGGFSGGGGSFGGGGASGRW